MPKKRAPPAKRKRTGRPSAYTPEIGAELCLRLALGESLRAICADKAMPGISSVIRWLFDPHPTGDPRLEFRAQYARARQVQAEMFADDIIDIADSATEKTVVVARFRVDVRKWTVGRLVPRYAKKLVLEGGEKPIGVAHKLDLRQAAREIVYILNQADPKKKKD